MNKTKMAIIILLIISLSVFLISNYITGWAEQTVAMNNNFKQKIIQDYRCKMRSILNSAKEGIMYDVNENNLKATNDENVKKIILRHVAPLKTAKIGDILLIRISPDERILYDSCSETIKPEGIKSREINDEIIIQKKAIKIISNYFKTEKQLNVFLNDDKIISSKDLLKIKTDFPELYKKLDKMISYKNIFLVENILNLIKEGKSTAIGENNYWVTKEHGKELLEWITIPPGALGFDHIPDSSWGIDNKNHRWIMILRSEEEKILKYYEEIDKHVIHKIVFVKILYIAFIIILTSSIVVIVYFIAISNSKNKNKILKR